MIYGRGQYDWFLSYGRAAVLPEGVVFTIKSIESFLLIIFTNYYLQDMFIVK